MKIAKTTKVSKEQQGTAKVWHQQTVKQSRDYQSAELVYGVELTCMDSPEDIKATIARAEQIVEEPMVSKFKEQQSLLRNLSRGNK